MPIESMPKFTPSAARLWGCISSTGKQSLVSNVWCGKCRHDVMMTNFSGVEKDGDLLLVGLCSECRNDVAKVVESAHILNCGA